MFAHPVAGDDFGDAELAPNFSRRGTDKTRVNACSSWEGSGVGWYMESPLSFFRMHWDLEPVRGTQLVWSPAFRRSGPAKAGTPNGGSGRVLRRALSTRSGREEGGILAHQFHHKE